MLEALEKYIYSEDTVLPTVLAAYLSGFEEQAG